MSFPLKSSYTSEDYWNLPKEKHAELIDGAFYDMAPPSRIHQRLVAQLAKVIGQYLDQIHSSCELYPAPFAVNIDGNDQNWVEPDISIICDKKKLTPKGCTGAPDFIIEIVSPSSRRMDYIIKNSLYSSAGVREYWIVDPEKKKTVVYWYDKDAAPEIFPFTQKIWSDIYDGLGVTIAELIEGIAE